MVTHLKFDSLRAFHGFKICNPSTSAQSDAGFPIGFQCHHKKNWNRLALFLTMCKAHGFHDEQSTLK
jgi:hypothetical protein